MKIKEKEAAKNSHQIHLTQSNRQGKSSARGKFHTMYIGVTTVKDVENETVFSSLRWHA